MTIPEPLRGLLEELLYRELRAAFIERLAAGDDPDVLRAELAQRLRALRQDDPQRPSSRGES